MPKGRGGSEGASGAEESGRSDSAEQAFGKGLLEADSDCRGKYASLGVIAMRGGIGTRRSELNKAEKLAPGCGVVVRFDHGVGGSSGGEI